MAMAKFTVDGTNKLLIAKPGVVDVDVIVDLYSDAKEHWIATSDNVFLFPFRSVAGDPIDLVRDLAGTIFLTNGWKIRPDEAHHTLTLTGNLRLEVGQTPGIFVPTLGAFTVLVQIDLSADAFLVNAAGGGPPLTKQDVRDAMALSTAEAAAIGSIDEAINELRLRMRRVFQRHGFDGANPVTLDPVGRKVTADDWELTESEIGGKRRIRRTL
jgi:hypothetical protein